MNQPKCCSFFFLKLKQWKKKHTLTFREPSTKYLVFVQQKEMFERKKRKLRNYHQVQWETIIFSFKNVWTHHIKLFSFHLNECVQFFILFKWKQMCVSFHAPNFMVRSMIFSLTAHCSPLTVHCSALYVIVRFYSVFQHFSILFVIFNIEKRRVGRHRSNSVGVPKNTKKEDVEKRSNFCGCKALSIIKHSEKVVVVCWMEVSLFSLQLLCCANENNRQIGSMDHGQWTIHCYYDETSITYAVTENAISSVKLYSVMADGGERCWWWWKCIGIWFSYLLSIIPYFEFQRSFYEVIIKWNAFWMKVKWNEMFEIKIIFCKYFVIHEAQQTYRRTVYISYCDYDLWILKMTTW